MAKKPRRRRLAPLPRALGPALERFPRLLKVLDRHGVTFCSGCLLTLASPPRKVAAYHAVPDPERFLADLRRALR